MSVKLSRRRFLGGVERPEDGAPAAAVSETCFAAQGTYCRSCGDACAERAIRFTLQTGGRATVAVDADLCTGCGDCAPVCPASAITVATTSRAQAKEAAHV